MHSQHYISSLILRKLLYNQLEDKRNRTCHLGLKVKPDVKSFIDCIYWEYYVALELYVHPDLSDEDILYSSYPMALSVIWNKSNI